MKRYYKLTNKNSKNYFICESNDPSYTGYKIIATSYKTKQELDNIYSYKHIHRFGWKFTRISRDNLFLELL